jgi:hypothetical protein
VFVFDTSAYLNGSRHHYFLDTMRPVWTLVEQTIDDGRVVLPREVYREIVAQDDAISTLIKRHKESVAEPSKEVQARVGIFQDDFSKAPLRDRADPFVMAEAAIRSFTVVTYEGITFSGAPARRAEKKLPAICARHGVRCCTLPQALQLLGLRL